MLGIWRSVVGSVVGWGVRASKGGRGEWVQGGVGVDGVKIGDVIRGLVVKVVVHGPWR
jgi:hypothetical protein